MRLAFHAPLKPPDHRMPSGDRRMARELMTLAAGLGHRVHLASRFRSYDRDGNELRQLRLRTMGTRLAHRLASRLSEHGPPDAWLTYHCYHKAPDWLGPYVSRTLDIPYLIVEPSLAAKRTEGPWAIGHAGAREAIAEADVLLAMTAEDADGISATVRQPAEVRLLPPFLTASPYRAAAAARPAHRAAMAQRLALDQTVPWLLTVAMMRPDVKRLSYLALADALELLGERPWVLLVVGDGSAAGEIQARFARLGPGRVRWLGVLSQAELPAVYASADLMVWPAFREAYGLALLEAQAAGVPVVACREGGVPEIVAHGTSGLLARDRSPQSLAGAVATLLDDAPQRRALGAAALLHVQQHHDAPVAAAHLADALSAGLEVRARRRRVAS